MEWMFVLLTVAVTAVSVVPNVVAGEDGIVYREFHVDSVIVDRYSTTIVTGVIFNNKNVSQQLFFQMQLRETAFISNFTM